MTFEKDFLKRVCQCHTYFHEPTHLHKHQGREQLGSSVYHRYCSQRSGWCLSILCKGLSNALGLDKVPQNALAGLTYVPSSSSSPGSWSRTSTSANCPCFWSTTACNNNTQSTVHYSPATTTPLSEVAAQKQFQSGHVESSITSKYWFQTGLTVSLITLVL